MLSRTPLVVLKFQGPDAATFLQGYATADLDKLAEHVAVPNAFCDIKGRVIANGFIAGDATDVTIVSHASTAARLEAALAKYLPFAKSRFSDDRRSLALTATQTGSTLTLAVDANHPGQALHALLGERLAATADSEAPDGRHADANELDKTFDAWDRACIEAMHPVIDASIAGMFLPQMLGLTLVGAVSFTKGCYLGQEIVARAEHRGSVKRALRKLHSVGTVPRPGATLTTAAGKTVGTVVQSAPTIATVLAVTSVTDDIHAPNCELRLVT